MIQVEGLTKVFEQSGKKNRKQVKGLEDVSFQVEEGEFFVLLGPSGSGKTTCLRMLAGLDSPSSGKIFIDDTPVFNDQTRAWIGPENRPVSMVFQSYALWPQMTVKRNIEFPIRHGTRKVSKADAQQRVTKVLDLLGLTPFADRAITQLSGGQQQRVALARALALEPQVLLMDEPLSNLDVELRGRVREEIKNLTAQLGITSVLVTHDQEEAFSMGDVVAVMNNGQIEQIGKPEEVYRRPSTAFVANFLDKMNLFDGKIVRESQGICLVQIEGGASIPVTVAEAFTVGNGVTLGIRPTGLYIEQRSKPDNILNGVIATKVFLGPVFRYDIKTAAGVISVKSGLEAVYNVGDKVGIQVKPTAAAIVEVNTKNAELITK